MSTATLNVATKLNPFDRLARVLPPVLDGRVRLSDGTAPGVSVDPREPGALLPGDYLLDESGVWLRVLEVAPAEDGTAVRCGRAPFATLTVPAGNRVSAWPMTEVVKHAHAGGAL